MRSTVLFTITSISNSITIVKITGWPLLLGKTAISCVLAVFLVEDRAPEQYLVLEFGLNLNQGCSGVGTAFPHLFLQHYIPDYLAKTIAYFSIHCLGVIMTTTVLSVMFSNARITL